MSFVEQNLQKATTEARAYSAQLQPFVTKPHFPQLEGTYDPGSAGRPLCKAFVRLFPEGNFKGECRLVGPGLFGVRDFPYGELIGSVQVPKGMRVTLWSSPGFTGPMQVLERDAAILDIPRVAAIYVEDLPNGPCFPAPRVWYRSDEPVPRTCTNGNYRM